MSRAKGCCAAPSSKSISIPFMLRADTLRLIFQMVSLLMIIVSTYPTQPLDPLLDVQQQLNASGERIQSMRGEMRQGELEDQKTGLVDTFYHEVNRAYGFRLEGRIDYEQFGIDDDGKTLFWTPGDKRIPMTATKDKFNFLA